MKTMNNKKTNTNNFNYRSLKEILDRLDYQNEGIISSSRVVVEKSVSGPDMGVTKPSSSPPSKHSNEDDDVEAGVRFREETTKTTSSGVFDLARFAFKWGKTEERGRPEIRTRVLKWGKTGERGRQERPVFKWGKTDRRGRESRTGDSREKNEGVVHEVAVGHKCRHSLQKLLYEMHAMEDVIKAATMDLYYYDADDDTSF